MFPISCAGARIGLSVTVKRGGVGDDRCRGAGEREKESVKEMDERAKEKEEESEVWAVDVELLFFSQMKC